MSADKDIKPAEIQDEDLNEVQGGLRTFGTAGIRASTSGLRPIANTLDATFTGDKVSFQDGDDLFLRKRPGRTK